MDVFSRWKCVSNTFTRFSRKMPMEKNIVSSVKRKYQWRAIITNNNKYQWEEPSAKSTDSEKLFHKIESKNISKNWKKKKNWNEMYTWFPAKSRNLGAMVNFWELISIIACCFQSSALITYKLCTHTLW